MRGDVFRLSSLLKTIDALRFAQKRAIYSCDQVCYPVTHHLTPNVSKEMRLESPSRLLQLLGSSLDCGEWVRLSLKKIGRRGSSRRQNGRTRTTLSINHEYRQRVTLEGNRYGHIMRITYNLNLLRTLVSIERRLDRRFMSLGDFSSIKTISGTVENTKYMSQGLGEHKQRVLLYLGR